MKLKRASILTKLLLVIVAVYALITLVSLHDRLTGYQAEVAELRQQNEYAEQAYLQVEQDIAELGTEKSDKKIARSMLHLVERGEKIFKDAEQQHE